MSRYLLNSNSVHAAFLRFLWAPICIPVGRQILIFEKSNRYNLLIFKTLKDFILFLIYIQKSGQQLWYSYEFFVRCDFYFGDIFWRNFLRKNEFPQIDPGSIWDDSWTSRASRNINLNALEASGIIKNIKNMTKVINSKIDQENEEIGG